MKREQLERIIRKKRQRINQVMNMKNAYKVAVFDGAINGKSVKEIHKDLYDITMSFAKGGIAPNWELYKVAKILTKQIKKKTYEEDGVLFPLFFFYGAKKKPVYTESGKVDKALSTTSAETVLNFYSYTEIDVVMDRIATDDGRKIEEEEKKQLIDDFGKEARKLKQIFFMASKHNDCANDHLAYQGKLYVIEKWKSKIEKKYHKAISDFITNNKIMTFEEITKEPVWLITRPNCRHYFQSIATDDALNMSDTEIVEKYKLSHTVGDRKNMQTYATKKGKRTLSDIKTMVYRYRERLHFHQELYKLDRKNAFIKKAIQKDKLLLKKWEKML